MLVVLTHQPHCLAGIFVELRRARVVGARRADLDRIADPAEDAFARLTLDELGHEFKLSQATLLGPYTHLYDDNVFGNEFTTHYIAIAYKLVVTRSQLDLPMDVQHSRYCWSHKDELLTSDKVHIHTKWYFQK